MPARTYIQPYNYWKNFFFLLSLITGLLSANGQEKKDSVLPKVDSLQAIIVRPKELRPHFKGDTLEYNTSNIRLRPNAVVEEMLGRLPGLQIDANGTITYNGTKIEKLLVDGEDVFGSDPTLVTRSFDAGRIEKVQLLDRKSDRASFTGMDDGNRTKTLNLVLKESSKKGYFGKVEGGGNTQGNYNGTGLLASFRNSEQFTALGMASNTDAPGFNSNMGNGQVQLSVFGGVADALGASAGKGIPSVLASGLHYANTWNGQNDHIAGNYQFGHSTARPFTATRVLQILPDSLYEQNQQAESINQQDLHSLDVKYDWLPDSLSAFKFFFSGSHSKGNSQFNAGGGSSFNGTPVNTNQRAIQSMANQGAWTGSMMWRRTIGRNPQRVLSLLLGLEKQDNTTEGYLQARNRFFRPDGNLQSEDTTDQKKIIASNNLNTIGWINYVEPISRSTSLAALYTFSLSTGRSLQSTYDKAGGKYILYVDSLSGNLREQTLMHQFTFNLQKTNGRLQYTIGANIFDLNYRQRNLLTDSLFNKTYLDLAPHASFRFRRNQSTFITFNYTANTQRPSPSQLQIIRSNTDPLHITLGNPGLRPGFSQALSVNYQKLKGWMTAINFTVGNTTNSISNRTITDSLGRQITQPVNVDGGRNATLNFMVSRLVLGIVTRFHSNFAYARNVSYINTELSKNDSYNPGAGIDLTRHVTGKYDLILNTQFNFNENKSSVNETLSTHYWEQHHNGALAIYLLRNYVLNANFEYLWQQAANSYGSNNSMFLLNAGIGRDLFSNALTVKFLCNNLLDEARGIGRSNVGNVNTETSTNILGRYWLLTLSWKFDHKHKGK